MSALYDGNYQFLVCKWKKSELKGAYRGRSYKGERDDTRENRKKVDSEPETAREHTRVCVCVSEREEMRGGERRVRKKSAALTPI